MNVMEPKAVIPYAKKLIKQNAHLLKPGAWKGLGKKNKRKIILLDAMKQVIGLGYRPQSHYRDIGIGNLTLQGHESLQKIIPEYENCEVCLRGMALLSCVRFNNNLTLSEYYTDNQTVNEEKSGLTKFFKTEELYLMEEAFEGVRGYLSLRDGVKAREFHGRYSGDNRKTLTIAIFLNAYIFGKFSPNKWLL